MESALYGIFTLGEVSEISLVRCAHSFDFRYFTTRVKIPYARAFHEVISILIIAITEKLFYKNNRKLFSGVCIAWSWYKHSRGWENSRQLCKPSTSSWVCKTVSNSPNPSRVYIRLCKNRKRFLLLIAHVK